MTKQEIKKVIENGESVWAVENRKLIEFRKNKKMLVNGNRKSRWNIYYKYRFTNEGICTCDDEGYFDKYFFKFSELYKSKAEAEHYLHHANVSRTEHLPFLTWEEFLEERHLSFIGKNEIEYMLCIFGDKIDLAEHRACSSFVIKEWHATEENFYKAYDECVRLFKGGE